MLTTTLSAETRAVVLAPVLNMHSKPTVDTDVVSQAIYGVNVGVLEEQAGWVKIKTPGDDYTGWVEAALLRNPEDGEGYAASGKVTTGDSRAAHLYREPSVTKHPSLVAVRS